jgi:hypothetical protein
MLTVTRHRPEIGERGFLEMRVSRDVAGKLTASVDHVTIQCTGNGRCHLVLAIKKPFEDALKRARVYAKQLNAPMPLWIADPERLLPRNSAL